MVVQTDLGTSEVHLYPLTGVDSLTVAQVGKLHADMTKGSSSAATSVSDSVESKHVCDSGSSGPCKVSSKYQNMFGCTS